ncbi:hypothetical protein NSQ20_30600 [Paenibacillus sp. FSL K6-1122]|uniref:hypothetical protein n=1 Tax=Paenibacillus TaxID=44249 RepID=UPI0003E25D55|nr:hypothetical protein [Paenibacillus amylolyticus]ETT49690.1 hypothetical protein C170_17387 [Paenibacillus sp. FSL H7-689]OME92485.1 hypothetical protein BK124_26770 [Paenibacillus amylolyticus]
MELLKSSAEDGFFIMSNDYTTDLFLERGFKNDSYNNDSKMEVRFIEVYLSHHGFVKLGKFDV